MSCVACRWWRRLRSIQRGLRMALGETKEGGVKSIIGRRTRHLHHLVFSSRLHSPSTLFCSFGGWNVRKVNVSGSVCERYDSFLFERRVRDSFWQGRQVRFLEGNRNSRSAESLVWRLLAQQLYILFLSNLINYEKIISYFFNLTLSFSFWRL